MLTQQESENQKEIVPLLETFSSLESILKSNSYIQDTTKKLHYILEDAASNTQILFVGKEGVGKTSVVNALLGRELLPSSLKIPTEVNTFIKYGEDERVEAYFYDGEVSSFSLNKIHMFINSQTEIAEKIRENVNYIVIYIKHELLKNVTLIDTKPIELLNNQSAYFSHTILSRVDEIIWVVRGKEKATEEELALLKKIATGYTKPYILINAIDEVNTSINQLIKEERSRYGEFVNDFYSFSAKQSINARKTNDTQDFIDSQTTTVMQLIEHIAQAGNKKVIHTVSQIENWLLQLQREYEYIPLREPYSSAIENMNKQVEASQLESSREKRDLAIIQTYALDYEQTANTFKEVETLYQLLKVIGSELYLRDDLTESFEELATMYQQHVRSYRTIYRDYETLFADLQKNIKKSDLIDGELHIQINAKANGAQLQEKVVLINEKQTVLESVWKEIKIYEDSIIEQLYTIQNHLMTLTTNRLNAILKNVADLNNQRKSDYKINISYSKKLEEFDCLVDAQQFLKETIKPYIDNYVEIDELSRLNLINTIDNISNISLQHTKYKENVDLDQSLMEPIKVNFEEQYKMFPLNLTDKDVLSDIPTIPSIIKVI